MEKFHPQTVDKVGALAPAFFNCTDINIKN